MPIETKKISELFNKKKEHYFLIILLLVALYFLYLILHPFIGSFLFAGIFASAFFPIHHKIMKTAKINKEASSLILILLLIILVFIPGLFLLVNVFEETIQLTTTLRNSNLLSGSNRWENVILNLHQFLSETIPFDIGIETLRSQAIKVENFVSNKLVFYINDLVGNTFLIFINFIFFILFLYTLMTQGKLLKKKIFTWSPLAESDEELILKRFTSLNKVLLMGNSLGGLIQSLISFVLMASFGIEKIFFWSLLIFLCSFIPVFGTSLLFIPMSLYLWFSGSKVLAIIFFAIMTITFLIIENLFKPRFIGERLKMNSLLVLFCLLGGVKFFGLVGIFYGPLLASLFLTLMEIVEKKFELNQENT